MKKTVIDLFCGAGGTTTGVNFTDCAEVIACVNHDPIAISSHSENHPECEHFIEDIRIFDEKRLPQCDILWASLECTHFSNAKGGGSRNEDSRTLAHELYRYISHCNPDFIAIENVREFRTWGPLKQKLDKNKNPVFKANGEPFMIPDTNKDKQGIYYLEWIAKICSMGYKYKWKLLDSANYGAYTSRIRYFGVFYKKDFEFNFPSPTHAKKEGLGYSKWKAVKDVLDFNNIGKSIFNRKKKLCENTLKRIHAGLIKFIADPFVSAYYNGSDGNKSIIEPAGTITTVNKQSIVTPFLAKYYSEGDNVSHIESPAPTLTTKDRLSFINPESFIVEQYGNSIGKSIEEPVGAILKNPKQNLIKLYLADYENFSNVGRTIEQPHNTILASKVYTRIIAANYEAEFLAKIDSIKDNSPWSEKIKDFMRKYGIADIKMRMLSVDELKRIQGFPSSYVLNGDQTLQKKFIGNSVVPIVAQKIIESICKSYGKH